MGIAAAIVGAAGLVGISESIRSVADAAPSPATSRPFTQEAANTQSGTGNAQSTGQSGGQAVGTQNNNGQCSGSQNSHCETTNLNLIRRPENEGVLIPARDPNPPANCQIPKDAFAVFFGNNVDWTTGASAVLTVKREPIIAFDHDSKKLKLTTLRVYDDQNNIIARVDADGFWTSPLVRIKKPDKSTLIVFDHLDQEVLDLRFLNPHTVSILGIFHSPSIPTPIVITPNGMQGPGMTISRSCMGSSGGSGFIEID
jgi:hypothetical protein